MSESKYDFSNSTFHGCGIGEGAQVIYNAPPPTELEYQEMMALLKKLKQAVDKDSADYRGLEAIENGAKKRNWSAVFSAIKIFAGQFTSATLANLAGSYLGSLLGFL